MPEPVHRTVSGMSMWPFLRADDRIRLDTSTTRLRAGDIVVYQTSEIAFCHRIVRFEPNGHLLLRGDYHFAYDEPIPRESLIGKVVAIENSRLRSHFLRWGRALTYWFQSRDWLIERLGTSPGQLLFALFYVGFCPWIYFGPEPTGRKKYS